MGEERDYSGLIATLEDTSTLILEISPQMKLVSGLMSDASNALVYMQDELRALRHEVKQLLALDPTKPSGEGP